MTGANEATRTSTEATEHFIVRRGDLERMAEVATLLMADYLGVEPLATWADRVVVADVELPHVSDGDATRLPLVDDGRVLDQLTFLNQLRTVAQAIDQLVDAGRL